MTIIAGLTDTGHRAGENQDSIGWEEVRSLAFVADGLGGHSGGQVASGIVKRSLLEAAASLDLPAAVLRAHAAILHAAEQDEHLKGMASTVVAAHIERRTAQIVWVGDSRAYLWRDREISRLTRDHSVVEELRDLAGLSETQIRGHPQRNEVTNVLGAGEPVPGTTELPLRRGDWILLCSDGLSGELRDEEIAGILALTSSPAQAAQRLIAAALEHGGHDNVSAVVVKYDGPSKRNFKPRLSEAEIGWLAVLGGVLLAVLLASAMVWIRRKR
ncbi:MAG TPA: protein phosphatase 2C domain-containing protein [Steroidobacteraceae bacterium]|nr:protein phosphatase 2C domain-containing protein [Steroidobacteraceae bacterium]